MTNTINTINTNNTTNLYINKILKLYNNAKLNGTIADKNKYYKILIKNKYKP